MSELRCVLDKEIRRRTCLKEKITEGDTNGIVVHMKRGANSVTN